MFSTVIYEDQQFHRSVVNSGSGTKEDPYIIEDQIFNQEDWTTHRIITDSNDYYIIRNCKFIASKYSGVWVYNSSNCKFEKCEFIKCRLVVHSSRNCIVSECTFREVDHQGMEGLSIFYSVNCSVIDNTAYGCFMGISVTASNDTLVSSNLVYDNIHGIELFFANDTFLEENRLFNNGLHIRCDYMGMSARAFFWYQYIGAKLVCSDNYVNDKPLRFYQDLTTGTIDASQFGQLILQNCSNVAVRNGLFSNTTYGIQFLFCDDISIRDAIATNYSRAGIDLVFTNSSSIVNCSVIGDDWWGVHAAACWNITIEDSNFEGNGIGLYLGSCNNCTISNNTAIRNENGIYLSYSHNSTFIGNLLRENYAGIYFYNSEQNLVINNSILYNTHYGVYLDWNSDYNRFFGNS
ncbi:MAG: NosD domain-containing protein, partial [Candidatus Thorarchaeota archaeon]